MAGEKKAVHKVQMTEGKRDIEFALNNERLKKRGLLSLTDHYLKYILKYELNRRMPNGTYGGVRGAKLIKS